MSKVYLLGLVGYPSDDINKFLWMVRIGGGVFPHIKEPDYLVRYSVAAILKRCLYFVCYGSFLLLGSKFEMYCQHFFLLMLITVLCILIMAYREMVSIELILRPLLPCLTASCTNFHITGMFMLRII